MVDTAELLRWGEWRPLATASRDPDIPPTPGLYRIRRIGRQDLDYIGQSGMGTMTLRKRLGMLRGVYADVMPYRDPHTAGPALWALRHQTGEDFEVSTVPIAGPTPWRKGMEALAIALYRQKHGRSPTVEFGRMQISYRASSSYNRRLLEAGRVFRGGQTEESDASHLPSIPPVGSLTGDPHAADWGGHIWSEWIRFHTSGALLSASTNSWIDKQSRAIRQYLWVQRVDDSGGCGCDNFPHHRYLLSRRLLFVRRDLNAYVNSHLALPITDCCAKRRECSRD